MRFGKPEGVDRNKNGLIAGLSAVALSMATIGNVRAQEGDYSFTYPNEDDAEYSVFHTGFDDSFQVAILKEPIGPIRRKAAAHLAGRLGISLRELCTKLANASVSTPYYASPTYAGRNLGFPGCKGSVRFPGDPQF